MATVNDPRQPRTANVSMHEHPDRVYGVPILAATECDHLESICAGCLPNWESKYKVEIPNKSVDQNDREQE